ncbi:GHSR-like protein [Mya arenaria]|uniref:GHSR-like protein n=1 Tax=Mya arenaria TaxID=6604 RepID=A0ABY7EZU4_MYAAR|nr:GHSR-like protein [Mya arenaria]
MNNTEKDDLVTVLGHFNWEKITGAVFLSPMILLGVLGNILTLLVFGTRQQRQTSIAIYLSALAASDIIVLILPAMEFWLYHVLHIYIRRSSDFMCRLFSYATSVLPCVSAWILVAVSTERMMGVCAPLKMKVFSKPKHAFIIVGCDIPFSFR